MGRIDKFEQNMVINGGMELWQRGTGFVNADVYTADRFRFVRDIGVTDINRSSDVPTPQESGYRSRYSMFLNVTTAEAAPALNEIHRMNYRMEGQDLHGIIGRSAYISFWVKTNKTGIYGLALSQSGTGRSYITEYTVNASQVWQRITKKIPIEFNSGWVASTALGLELEFTLAAGPTRQTSTLNQWFNQAQSETTSVNQVNFLDAINNEFRITQVQVVTVENDFRDNEIILPFRSIGRTTADELSLAQRYYWTQASLITIEHYMFTNNFSRFVLPVLFPATMRTTPAIVTNIVNPINVRAPASSFATINNVTPQGFSYRIEADAGGAPVGVQADFKPTADAEL